MSKNKCKLTKDYERTCVKDMCKGHERTWELYCVYIKQSVKHTDRKIE